MPFTYSFIKPLPKLLTEHLREAYPGLLRIITLFYDDEQNCLYWYLSVKGNDYEELLATEDLNTFRKPVKQAYNWIDPKSIPISQDVKKNSEITIFDESDKLVLSMRFTNPYDMQQDVIFAEFNYNGNFFGLKAGNTQITAEKKAIISELIYSGLLSMYNRCQKDYELWQKLSSHVNYMQKQSSDYSKVLEKEKEAYKQSIERLVREYANSFSKELGRKIIISNDAMQSLRSYSGELIILKDILKDAIIFAANLNDLNSELTIESPYINYSLSRSTPKLAETSTYQKRLNQEKDSPNREMRARQYLYRLSEAVEEIISRGDKVTGSNVGAACTPPISAPAISDFLTKYRVAIKHIIQAEPSKWQLLIKYFRPISNIMDSPTSSAIKSA
ncbi:MAG TPA: hypothetical protein PLO05_09185 [Bacteroidales bacterium]|nr:hypothetical protein [Bacteroidales bacterium]